MLRARGIEWGSMPAAFRLGTFLKQREYEKIGTGGMPTVLRRQLLPFHLDLSHGDRAHHLRWFSLPLLPLDDPTPIGAPLNADGRLETPLDPNET